MLTGVIDYGAGNLRSVCNALDLLKAESKLIREPSDFAGVDAVVFPGVGAFGDSMKHLLCIQWMY